MLIEVVTAIQLCCGIDMGQSPWPQQAPAQYAHPYNGHLHIQRGTPAQIHLWCRSFFARACAKPGAGSCTIYLPTPTPGGAPVIYKALYDHEVAHCNGWRHPGSG